jgi:hypothetical protein
LAVSSVSSSWKGKKKRRERGDSWRKSQISQYIFKKYQERLKFCLELAIVCLLPLGRVEDKKQRQFELQTIKFTFLLT